MTAGATVGLANPAQIVVGARDDADVSASWSSSGGRGAVGWMLAQTADGFRLLTGGTDETFAGEDSIRLSVSRWWFGRSLVVQDNPPRRFRGVRSSDARDIRAAVARHVARARLSDALAAARSFEARFRKLIEGHLNRSRWIRYDAAARPTTRRRHRRECTGGALSMGIPALDRALRTAELESLDFLSEDHAGLIQSANAEISAKSRIATRLLRPGREEPSHSRSRPAP